MPGRGLTVDASGKVEGCQETMGGRFKRRGHKSSSGALGQGPILRVSMVPGNYPPSIDSANANKNPTQRKVLFVYRFPYCFGGSTFLEPNSPLVMR